MIHKHKSTQVFIPILHLLQPPTLPQTPLPLSISAFPFNPPASQPPPSVFQISPSVPFAALSDPFKIFDGLDHTYPPKKF